jgi:hypothetical protein
MLRFPAKLTHDPILQAYDADAVRVVCTLMH